MYFSRENFWNIETGLSRSYKNGLRAVTVTIQFEKEYAIGDFNRTHSEWLDKSD